MKIQSFTFNFFAENTYVLYDDTKECVIIDPGCYFEEEKKQLADFIENNGLTPVMLLNTHCHIDHIFGNAYVADKYGIKFYCHALEEPWLKQAPVYGKSLYDVNVDIQPVPAGYLQDGDTVTFGNTTLEMLFAPGHSVGSIIFYNKEAKAAIVGDVIFHRSIGRTDLPGGSYPQLENSIKTKVYTLPEDTALYPGHMEPTTVGEEMLYNPFVKG